MTTQTTIKRLRKQIYSEYASSVGLEPKARYLHGTPLRPVVPLDAAKGGVLFIGAYPSARFMTIEGIRDVPVADNLGPFESERWFDGGWRSSRPFRLSTDIGSFENLNSPSEFSSA